MRSQGGKRRTELDHLMCLDGGQTVGVSYANVPPACAVAQDRDDGRTELPRRSVGLTARLVRGRPQFMVIAADNTPWGCDHAPTFGRLLSRAEAVDTPLADEVFDYVDRIRISDPRIARFVATGEGVDGHGRPSARPRSRTWAKLLRFGN